MNTSDPLEPTIDWIYPKTDKDQLLRNKNFLFANDTISNDASHNTSQDLEYIFYDMKLDSLIVVEPIDILELLNITVLDRGDGDYAMLPITLDEWLDLKHQLCYIGII